MKTLILDRPGVLRLTDIPPPATPGPDEALVRVLCVGICGSDLHAYRGRQPFFTYPRILGHELSVEIVALGPLTQPTTLKVGDRCAVEPYLNCGQCRACRQGKTNCCAHLKVLGVHIDGGMREHITVPVHKLHPSATLPPEHLALVETLCIGAHAVRRARLTAGDPVLVIGAGPIGLTVIRFAQLAGAEVIVMEVSEKRMAFCRAHLGIERTVDGREEAAPQLRRLLSGDLPAVVFDATGNAQSMMAAFDLVEQGGTLVFVGLVQDSITFHDPEFHRREMTLLASRNATAADFAFVIHHLEAGRIRPAPWITHHATPEALADAFPGWLNPDSGVIKVMLDWSS